MKVAVKSSHHIDVSRSSSAIISAYSCCITSVRHSFPDALYLEVFSPRSSRQRSRRAPEIPSGRMTLFYLIFFLSCNQTEEENLSKTKILIGGCQYLSICTREPIATSWIRQLHFSHIIGIAPYSCRHRIKMGKWL